ncbi:hypothetical protein C8R46DRAFT_830203, partial [Mycena filopes]
SLLIVILSLAFVSRSVAGQNTTIDDTDPSIQYSDGDHSEPCALDANGNVLGGQPGCFFNGVHNCSSGAHLLETQNSTLSMKFKGSAIYVNALLDNITNLYTITLDGKSTDVDGLRPGSALLCYTLFSQTDLDPTIEHNIGLSIKGVSPNLDTSATEGPDPDFFFWLDNFVVTTSAGNSTSNTTSTKSSPQSSPAGTKSSS